MTEPAAGSPPIRRLNFTALQFVLFAGSGVVGLAALLAAGLAVGLALAGAAMIAVFVLAAWIIAANLIGDGRSGAGPRRPLG